MFRYLLLRWGIPLVVYLDNGKVYVSRQFRSVLAELKIRELHHKPYQAFAKGKVEAVQKTVKNEFQSEAARAGMKTVEELNSAFWAWAEMEYNSRIHSSTGQAPDERFQQGILGLSPLVAQLLHLALGVLHFPGVAYLSAVQSFLRASQLLGGMLLLDLTVLLDAAPTRQHRLCGCQGTTSGSQFSRLFERRRDLD